MKRQSKQILFQWERRYSDAECKSMREVLNQQESRSVQSQEDEFVRFLVCYRSEYWRKESDTVAVWYLFHENNHSTGSRINKPVGGFRFAYVREAVRILISPTAGKRKSRQGKTTGVTNSAAFNPLGHCMLEELEY